jgi:S-adenosylhomocysteine hydrolase
LITNTDVRIAVDAIRRATDVMLAGKEWLYADLEM